MASFVSSLARSRTGVESRACKRRLATAVCCAGVCLSVSLCVWGGGGLDCNGRDDDRRWLLLLLSLVVSLLSVMATVPAATAADGCVESRATIIGRRCRQHTRRSAAGGQRRRRLWSVRLLFRQRATLAPPRKAVMSEAACCVWSQA